MMSYEAFYEDGVRKSVWKVPFTNWLPLYINREHGEKFVDVTINYIYDQGVTINEENIGWSVSEA
jgi:hypothetical protein